LILLQGDAGCFQDGLVVVDFRHRHARHHHYAVVEQLVLRGHHQDFAELGVDGDLAEEVAQI
jgi:hypothetical protein